MGCSEAIGALAAVAVVHTVITLVIGAVVAVLLLYPRKDQPKRKTTSTQKPDGTQESASPREATSPDILVTNSAAYSQQSKSGDDSLDSPLPITAIEFEPSAQESMISAVRRRSRLSIASITSGVTRQFRKSMELANEETIELINTTEKERIASSTESISQEQDESTTVSGDPEAPPSSM